MFAGFNNLGNCATGSNQLGPAWAEIRSRSARLDHWWWLNKDNHLGWRGGGRGAQPTCKWGGEPFNSRERAASKAVVVFLVERLHLHLKGISINSTIFQSKSVQFYPFQDLQCWIDTWLPRLRFKLDQRHLFLAETPGKENIWSDWLLRREEIVFCNYAC